jgi:hypothetical protein
VLCHKIGDFQINSFTFLIISISKIGESLTSLSKIFVIFEFSSGIGIKGFIRVENVSVISKVSESNFTNAISMILSFLLSSHVVSKSRATICIWNIY